MSSVDNLPVEILLKIFAYLDRNDVGQCLQVSKRFRNIAQAESLWNKIELESKVFRRSFIGQALSYGLKELCLEECRVQYEGDETELPERNKLQSLYFGAPWTNLDDRLELEFLSDLLSSCQHLKKLI